MIIVKKTIDYIVADPEGNITILVLTPVEQRDYQTVATQLLQKHAEAEQVGYVLPSDGSGGLAGSLPKMNMCGMEFCGNASRAFAFYQASCQQPALEELDVEVSGCDHPLHAWIRMEPEREAGIFRGTVRVEMPLPEEIEDIRLSITRDLSRTFGLDRDEKDCSYLTGRLVHLDGISHLVVTGIRRDRLLAADRESVECLFHHIRDNVYQLTSRDLPAFGTMFVDPGTRDMTPIVYVRDVDTTYFEGSCASGTAAAACACALEEWDEAAGSARFSYAFAQPRGTLCTDVCVTEGRISRILLYGGVKLPEARQAEVEVQG